MKIEEEEIFIKKSKNRFWERVFINEKKICITITTTTCVYQVKIQY